MSSSTALVRTMKLVFESSHDLERESRALVGAPTPQQADAQVAEDAHALSCPR